MLSAITEPHRFLSQKDDINSKPVRLILKEVGLTATCLEQGLTALRKADFAQKWNYYQAFFLLTIGIERLCKLTIITISGIESNKLPDNGELKRFGHKIEDLFKNIEHQIDPESTFLDQDEIYSKLLKFLTDFASSARYYNLDSLSGIERNDDPLYDWHEIQNIIKKRHIKPVDLSTEEQVLVNILNNSASIHHTDEFDNPITDFSTYYEHGKVSDKLQGYSVFYVYQIIQRLVQLLENVSSKKYLMPVLSEFLVLFNPDVLTNSEIRRRKNWNYLTNRR